MGKKVLNQTNQLNHMSKKIRSQMAEARARWAEADEPIDKLYWALMYLRGRTLIACRLGDTPTAYAWQRIHNNLEAFFLEETKFARLQEKGWEQSYEYVPHRGKREYAFMSRDDNYYARNNSGLDLFQDVSRVVTHPHSLPEAIKTTGGRKDSDVEYGDDEDDDEYFSWEEFSRRIDAFERKMRERKAVVFSRIRGEDEDSLYDSDFFDSH